MVGIPKQKLHLCGAIELGIDSDIALKIEPCETKCQRRELAHRMRFARSDDVVVRFVLLKHQPHRTDVVLRVTPVATGVEVTEQNVIGGSRQDARDTRGDFIVTNSNPRRGGSWFKSMPAEACRP